MSGKKSPAEDAVGETVREIETREKAILKIPFLENPSLLFSESNALLLKNVPISPHPTLHHPGKQRIQCLWDGDHKNKAIREKRINLPLRVGL